MHIIVFFTYGVSLKLWNDTGLLDRELLVYRRFVKNGYKITLFTYGGKEDLEFKDFLSEIRIVPAYIKAKRHNNKMLRFLFSFTLPFIFKDFFKSADIFKTNQMLGSWVPVIGKLLYKKKLVTRCGYELLRNWLRDKGNSIRGKIGAFFYFILEVIAYGYADWIIMASKTNIKFVKERLHVPGSKISLIRNFIDTENFAPNNQTNLVQLSNNSFLYVGRLIKIKNLKSLLSAVKDLKVNLDIIGEGNQISELKEHVKKLGIRVNFLGIFPNSVLPKLINNYSFFILPSFYENSPKTLLEAMACGRVVIGTNVEGIKELISDEETGFLCKPDSISINYAIKRAINMTIREREKMGASAREFVINECSLEKTYQREKDIYEQTLSH